MANSFAAIEIGKRSLMAHSTQINTAGHNISNADTEGYSRQRVQIKTFDPIYRPDLEREERAGQLGQGTSVESINRLRDELLDQRIVAQTNQETYWTTREKYYTMIEQVYNEPDEISIRSNMDKYWQSWQELSVYPESQAARQAVVTRGETLAESIQQRYTALSGIGTLINGDTLGLKQRTHLRHRRLDDGARAETDNMLHLFGSECTDEGGHVATDSAKQDASSKIEHVNRLGDRYGNRLGLCTRRLADDFCHLCRMAELGEISDCYCHFVVCAF